MNDRVINEVTERLKALGIQYELDEHEAVFTIEAIIALDLNKKGMIPSERRKREASFSCDT